MSDVSVFATKFNSNSKSLREFEKSLDFLRGKDKVLSTPESEPYLQVITHFVKSVTESMAGTFKTTCDISLSVSAILKEWHDCDWPTYSQQMSRLAEKLQQQSFSLSDEDFSLLNDVADAMDSECQSLVRRMRGGK